VRTHVFKVVIERDEDGRWAAECPALPGCATDGATHDEALKNIQEAVEAYVADLLAVGEPIPTAHEIIDAPAVSVVALG
jgi:predicted RNase H-like HicB family nuclease